MNEVSLAAGTAIGGWWLSTGVVLYLNQLPTRSHRWSLGVATLVLLASLAGLHAGRDDTSMTGAVVAFAQASMALVGWRLLRSFRGRRTPAPPDRPVTKNETA